MRDRFVRCVNIRSLVKTASSVSLEITGKKSISCFFFFEIFITAGRNSNDVPLRVTNKVSGSVVLNEFPFRANRCVHHFRTYSVLTYLPVCLPARPPTLYRFLTKPNVYFRPKPIIYTIYRHLPYTYYLCLNLYICVCTLFRFVHNQWRIYYIIYPTM